MSNPKSWHLQPRDPKKKVLPKPSFFRGRPYHLTRHTRAAGELLPPGVQVLRFPGISSFTGIGFTMGKSFANIFGIPNQWYGWKANNRKKTRVFVKFTFSQKEGNLLKYRKSWGEFVQRELDEFWGFFWGVCCVSDAQMLYKGHPQE